MTFKIIARNRKAGFQYFLMERFEAGLELKGSEIKSIRAGRVSLAEAYVRVDGRQAWLAEAHIAPYEEASYNNHPPRRERRLLLHKKEIQKLWESTQQKGMTIVPVSMYLKGGRAKLEIALAKGKKLYDKRAAIAERETKREIARQRKR